MPCQKRTLALSYHVKARIYMVYTGFQLYTTNHIRHVRYSSRKMACSLDPQYDFLYRYFTCNLTMETIDMEVIICILKEIHTYRNNREYPNRPHPLPFVKSPKPPQRKEDTWKQSATLRNYVNQEE